MATPADALEALLQFREGGASDSRYKLPIRNVSELSGGGGSVQYPASVQLQPRPRYLPVDPGHHLPQYPVPNPLDQAQRHLIEAEARRVAYGRGATIHSSFALGNPRDAITGPFFANPYDAADSGYRRSIDQNPNWIVNHGGPAMHHVTPISPVVAGGNTEDIRAEKILDALNSKPQRGKKRQDLNELERLELTRTRNREHAKSTRCKKKARHDNLVDIEKKYQLLQEKEKLHARRKQSVVDLVKQRDGDAMRCIHSSRLHELASQDILNPEFSVTGGVAAVALTAADSGSVKVTVHGSELDSSAAMMLTGVVCVDFVQESSDIRDISLYWSTTASVQ